MTPTATRQPHSWATQPVMTRPLMPPTLFPATTSVSAPSAVVRSSRARAWRPKALLWVPAVPDICPTAVFSSP